MLDKFLKHIIVLIIFIKSVISVRKLNSINDLRNIDFGQRYPRHGLLLLHWFANNINIDNNSVITLQRFEPNRGDYGFHHYGNSELLLDLLPWNSEYYTLGNLKTAENGNARALPTDVTSTYQNAGRDRNRNRDRIIISIRQADNSESTQIIDQVYITQHYESPNRGSAYDPGNTYSVTPNLLREIRNLPQHPNQQQKIQELQPQYGFINLNILNNNNDYFSYSLKLLLYIVTAHHRIRYWRHRKTWQVLTIGDNVSPMQLEVQTLTQGKAKLSWRDIPSQFDKVVVALYKDDQANSYETYKSVENNPSGSYETSSYLDPGFQVRLHMPKNGWFSTYPGLELWRGPELHDANKELPTYIRGYGASLQLFVRDGKACVRLYLKKSFTDWETAFYYSWVGIYSSDSRATSDYESYKWVTKFKKESRTDLENIPDYNVYYICTSEYIAPGIQARFMLTKEYRSLVRTPQWKGVFSEDLIDMK